MREREREREKKKEKEMEGGLGLGRKGFASSSPNFERVFRGWSKGFIGILKHV